MPHVGSIPKASRTCYSRTSWWAKIKQRPTRAIWDKKSSNTCSIATKCATLWIQRVSARPRAVISSSRCQVEWILSKRHQLLRKISPAHRQSTMKTKKAAMVKTGRDVPLRALSTKPVSPLMKSIRMANLCSMLRALSVQVALLLTCSPTQAVSSWCIKMDDEQLTWTKRLTLSIASSPGHKQRLTPLSHRQVVVVNQRLQPQVATSSTQRTWTSDRLLKLSCHAT